MAQGTAVSANHPIALQNCRKGEVPAMMDSEGARTGITVLSADNLANRSFVSGYPKDFSTVSIPKWRVMAVKSRRAFAETESPDGATVMW